jgi:hypothetical protein
MASARERLFVFPAAPSPEAVEWPGEPVGRSNIVTRTKSRTKFHDKTIDRTLGRREHLVNAAIAHVVRNAHHEMFALGDVVIHGIRVRAITNSPHLIQFWRDNWYSPEELQAQTGIAPPTEPTITVYALGGVIGEPEAAYYSRVSNTIIFFNTSYYGQLKSWVLGAVGRVLAADYGIHSLHGACVEREGAGILYIAPTGTGKSTSSYGLMTDSETRFHSDDWVYVRYARYTSEDQLLVPIEISTPNGETIRGFRCNPWIESNPNARGVARCLNLTNGEVTVDVRAFDRTRPVGAYAYTSEKVFYLRSNLIENFPDAGDAILRSDLENVPAASASFLRSNASTIDAIVEGIRTTANPSVRRGLGAMSEDALRRLVASLFAFDNSRAMLDIAMVFPASRVFTNPMEPVRLGTVFLLKRDPTDPVVLKVLSQNDLMERLLIGRTPDGKREIAYNAYRAVDDEEEKAAVEAIAKTSKRLGQPLYGVFQAAKDLPESLVEEFSLFRQLYQATLCYDCNTTLQRDPLVTSKKEAVRLTLAVILRGAQNRERDLCLTLDNYRSSIRGG